MEHNKKKTSQGEFWMDQDGILYQDYSPGAELKLEDSLATAALIVSHPVSRIIGNFYMGINKTKMPVRMFTRTEDAKKWLKDFLP